MLLFGDDVVKVCGIIGSPCKNGNVDLLVSQVLRGAASKRSDIVRIYLNDLKIKPCQCCGIDPYPKYCLFNDDMNEIYDALQTSDAIVLGSPVYFDTVTAQVKLMIDRSNCLTPYIKRTNGAFGFERRVKKEKKGVFIAVGGAEQEFNAILATVKGFFNWTNIKLVETFFFSHDDNELGNIKNDEEKMKRAFEIGIKIVC